MSTNTESKREMKTIGVLTSGGDAPGMNAAIRAVTRAALDKGIRVMGIRRGYVGLMEGDIVELDKKSVSEKIDRGGTFLYSARSEEFKTEAGMKRAVANCKMFGLDGVVVIGGDGSFRGASDLSQRGIPCIGIPGTIDNDIACSEYTIGFDTAVNTVMENVDKIRDTMQSHNRCSVVEVMGRKAGYIALSSGIACGATAVLVPEIPYDFEKDIIERMRETLLFGKQHYIIIAAEGVEKVDELAKKIEDTLSIVTKYSVLGHVQRGGSPTMYDRYIASMMGYSAVQLIADGIGDRVIAMKDGKIVDYDIQAALKMTKTIDMTEYNMVRAISTAGLEQKAPRCFSCR